MIFGTKGTRVFILLMTCFHSVNSIKCLLDEGTISGDHMIGRMDIRSYFIRGSTFGDELFVCTQNSQIHQLDEANIPIRRYLPTDVRVFFQLPTWAVE